MQREASPRPVLPNLFPLFPHRLQGYALASFVTFSALGYAFSVLIFCYSSVSVKWKSWERQKMEKTVTLDIETIPTQSPDALQRALDAVKAPGQYKNPEAIEAWLVQNRDAVAQEALAKTSFDPAKGHICTIAWAIDDGDVFAAHAESVDQEAHVLRQFFSAIDDFHRTTFIGHYIGGFDLRFVLCRAVVLGVQIPRCIPRDPKPWDKTIFDTMIAWAGSRGTISMDNLCSALGIQGKDGFDGSMVADAWRSGDHQTIIDYCKADVKAARNIWLKFQAVGW